VPPNNRGTGPVECLLGSKGNSGSPSPLIALELVAHVLALVQIADPRPFNGRNVNEDILRTIIGLNKPIALLSVEPLHSSVRHFTPY
jgi:hypothetical protein